MVPPCGWFPPPPPPPPPPLTLATRKPAVPILEELAEQVGGALAAQRGLVDDEDVVVALGQLEIADAVVVLDTEGERALGLGRGPGRGGQADRAQHDQQQNDTSHQTASLTLVQGCAARNAAKMALVAGDLFRV